MASTSTRRCVVLLGGMHFLEGMPCTQCKLLYVNYLNPVLAFFHCLVVQYQNCLRFLCIDDVAHLNCHPCSPIFSHFSPFLPGFVARSLL